jgi:hypothetical protein
VKDLITYMGQKLHPFFPDSLPSNIKGAHKKTSSPPPMKKNRTSTIA